MTHMQSQSKTKINGLALGFKQFQLHSIDLGKSNVKSSHLTSICSLCLSQFLYIHTSTCMYICLHICILCIHILQIYIYFGSVLFIYTLKHIYFFEKNCVQWEQNIILSLKFPSHWIFVDFYFGQASMVYGEESHVVEPLVCNKVQTQKIEARYQVKSRAFSNPRY